jgi:hypothetical protein
MSKNITYKFMTDGANLSLNPMTLVLVGMELTTDKNAKMEHTFGRFNLLGTINVYTTLQDMLIY